MSKAIERVRDVDFDALWERSDQDLEMSDDGQIRPLQTEASRPQRNAARAALGVAGPAVAGIAGIALSEIGRWD